MLKCKICQQNDTDSTTGICWECMGFWWETFIEYYAISREFTSYRYYYKKAN